MLDPVLELDFSSSIRIAMAHRRNMFQRGEVHNKPSGFWGMIKSVTTSSPGGESILYCPAVIRGEVGTGSSLFQ